MRSNQSKSHAYLDQDRGYAWLVLIGAVMSVCIQVGIVSSLGALVEELSQQFDTSSGQIGLAASLSPGFGVIFGPIAGGASKLFGARRVVMIAASLCVMGLILGSQAEHLGALTFSIILTGMGSAVNEISVGSLARYFNKYYALAIAIATSGISLGIMGSAPLTAYLLGVYGWRGTLLILGGLCSHLLITGALLRPVHNNNFMYQPLEGDMSAESGNKTASGESEPRYKAIIKKLLKNVVEVFDLSLWTNFSYIVMVILLGCLGYTFTGWLIYQTPYALSEHYSLYRASLLSTVAGVGNLVSKFATPYLEKFMSIRMILYISVSLKGLSLITMGMFKQYSVLMILAALYGSSSGIFTVAWYVRIRELVNEDQSVNAMAWAVLVNGEVSILSGWLTGQIFDITGSYTVSFLLLGAVQFVGVLFLLIEDLVYMGRRR